jgi:hypothetical protein
MRFIAVKPFERMGWVSAAPWRWHALEQLPSGQPAHKTACGMTTDRLDFDVDNTRHWRDWLQHLDGRCLRCRRVVELREIVGDEPEPIAVGLPV